MRRTTLAMTTLLLALGADAAVLPGARVLTIAPQPVLRGSEVTLGTTGLSGDYPHIRVHLTRIGEAVKPVARDFDGAFSDDASTIEFSIPQTLPLGTYKVEVFVTPPAAASNPDGAPSAPPSEAEVPVSAAAGRLAVTSETPVEVTGIHPTVSFPTKNQFEFRVVGSGFSTISEDNILEVEGVGRFQPCVVPGTPQGCVKVLADDDGRELLFSGFARQDVRGLQKMRVRVGRSVSAWTDVRLSRVGKLVPLVVALGTVAALMLLVGLVVRPLLRPTRAGARTTIATTLFLDAETNTYSLSKLQIYLWMAAAIFAYVYLTIAFTFVQGNDNFPEFPENLPGILLISVGTSALATGITAAKGSKGAGAAQPSAADFLTSGGVLAPDRLQFFGWTVVGVAAFVTLVLLRHPATIKDLPTVPEGLLTLMGISSAGYLAGKLARKAGPVIKQIVALFGSPLTIELRGEHLSPDATLTIDATPITRAHLDEKLHPDGRAITDVLEPGSEFAKVLKLTIPAPPPEWQQGHHTLILVNPDGQRAEWPFDVVSREVAGKALPSAGTSQSPPQLPIAG